MYLTIKDVAKEDRLFRSRLYLLITLVFLSVFVLVARLFYLQVIMHEKFIILSKDNSVKVLPVAPIRGMILSADGVVLAENKASFALEIVPENVSDIDQTIVQLKTIINISEADTTRFKLSLSEAKHFNSIPLRFDLTEQEIAKLSVDLHRYDGVDIVSRLVRHYPLAEEFAHTVGYVARIDNKDLTQIDTNNYRGTTHIGKTGIERAYEHLLHGTVGYKHVESNAQGRIVRSLEQSAPVSGKTVHLSINASLQRVAFEALDGRAGAIVAIDPKTGDVLAAVSSPVYDPNLFVNGISSSNYEALNSSKRAPLLNRFIQGQYSPGSTIKPFLGLFALEAGIRTSTYETWCPGWYRLKHDKHLYRDWKKEGHGHVMFNMAIIQSCDVYFYELAHDLGLDGVSAALSQFGFGRTVGIEIGGETSGLVPTEAWKNERFGEVWLPGETLILGIGQGYLLATPIQLAKAVAILATRGEVIRPRLVSGISDILATEIQYFEPIIEDKMEFNDIANLETVIQSMRDVVHGERGTARSSGINSEYEFAGKTGTVQLVGIAQGEDYDRDALPEHLRDHALFIAFAPVQDPKIAVTIIVENGGSGSATAAPISRALFDNYLLEQSTIN